MTQAPNSKDASSQQDIDYSALVQNIKTKALDSISLLMDSMFDGADDFLFSLADKAENNQAQQAYFDIMRLLRLERPQINSEFLSHLKISLQPASDIQSFEDNKDKNSISADDELCLIDEHAMEEMVALSGVETKAMQLHREPLKDLSLRLDVLKTKSPLAFSEQALSPKNICDGFQRAIAPISDELDIQNKLIIYKLFDLMVMVHLGQIYEEANRQLVAANILPIITISIKTPSSSAASSIINSVDLDKQEQNLHNTIDANIVPTELPGYATPVDTALYQTVNRYLGRVESTSNANTSVNTQIPVNNEFAPAHIISALSQLQQNSTFDSLLQPTEIKRALQQQLSVGQSGAITQQVSHQDATMIDLVQRLYEVILSNKNVTEPAQSLFLKLQIPIIKAALIDKNLLATSGHPVKQLLDLFIENIAGIEDKTDKNYVFFEKIANQINKDFNQESDFFESILEKVKNWVSELFKEATETEKNTQKHIFKDNARKAVIIQLRQSLKYRQFPEAQHDLVLKHWSTVMYRCHLNYGVRSSEWDAITDFLEMIVSSFQPIRLIDDEEEKIETFKNIRTQTEILLYKVTSKKDQVIQAIKALEITHDEIIAKAGWDDDDQFEKTLDYSDQEAGFEYGEEPDPAEEPIDIDSEIERVTNDASPSDELIWPDYIQPGAWFDVRDPKYLSIRKLKLSVILSAEELLIFVDKNGVKALEITAEKFIESIESGDSVHVENVSIFDKSLSTAISQLSAVG